MKESGPPSRREFLAGVCLLIGEFAILKALPKGDGYKPIGHFSAGDPGSENAQVYLDGKKISHVFELNDLEGWVRRYVLDSEPRFGRLPIERLTGEVRLRWSS